MPRIFGTDGIRGLANADLGPELATSVAVAAARVLADPGRAAAASSPARAVAVIGRDPRVSGEMLEAALVAGFTSAGVDVVRLGVVPTPAVAFAVRALGADLGVMVSASHNPMPDNGIKLFDRDGNKLADAVEDAIAAGVGESWVRPTGADVGRVRDDDGARDHYLEHLLTAVDHRLDGLHVVVDCAHGAASTLAPEAYRRAGARVTAIACEPDGLNINDGVGSTHLDGLVAAVRDAGADLGIAHDGDADRCLAVAADGSVVDGDALLAISALALHEAGRLTNATVVTTVMTNLGFKHAMAAHGIAVVETGVGDRYVLEAMRAGGYALGGEQSGHVVFAEHATTGDGLLTALHVLARVAATGRSLAELAAVMTRLPQVLLNVPVVDKSRLDAAQPVWDAVRAAEAALGESGRVLVRTSGTEHLVRVMVEAATEADAQTHADAIAGAVRTHLA